MRLFQVGLCKTETKADDTHRVGLVKWGQTLGRSSHKPHRPGVTYGWERPAAECPPAPPEGLPLC